VQSRKIEEKEVAELMTEYILHIIGGILLVFTVIDDLKYKQIRIMPIILTGVLGLFLRCALQGDIVGGLLGAVVGMLLIAIGKITRQAIGYGDGVIFISIGVLIGLKQVAAVLFISLLLAFVYSVVLLVLRRAKRKTAFPFVPFVFLAYAGIHFL